MCHLLEMGEVQFYKMKYSTPVDKRVFVGWKNYIEVFRNKDIFASLWLSLYYMVGSVGTACACAVPCNDFEL